MTKKEIIDQLTSLDGIGKSKAELLYDNGYDSLEKISKASIKDLTKVKGISEKFANNIKVQLKEKNLEKKKEIKEEEIQKKPVPTTDTKDKELEVKEEEKEEEKKYVVKKKPSLTKEKKDKLTKRKQIKKRTPEFLREEWFRYKKIPKNWRKPDGITSKMRINLKYRPSKVRIGFRGPKDVRGLHSSGFEEIFIYNIKELNEVDPKTQAVRIGKTVGTKKRNEIEKKAEELDIRILNL